MPNKVEITRTSGPGARYDTTINGNDGGEIRRLADNSGLWAWLWLSFDNDGEWTGQELGRFTAYTKKEIVEYIEGLAL